MVGHNEAQLVYCFTFCTYIYPIWSSICTFIQLYFSPQKQVNYSIRL